MRAFPVSEGYKVHTVGAQQDGCQHACSGAGGGLAEARMPAERSALALNTYLPADIRIQDCREVRPDFHPRFAQTGGGGASDF